MDAAFSSPYYFGSGLALFCGLVALFKWKLRRTFAARRVSRGLRVYTEGRQVVS